MRVGVPSEVKNNEFRVAITPSGVHELTSRGHEVLVQSGAGVGSSIPDDAYGAAGAKVVDGWEPVWTESEMILKVKEPVEVEYDRLQPGQVLFTYLHLAANQALHQRTARPEGHRDRVRDGASCRTARCRCSPP